MIFAQGTDMSSVVILYMVLIQGALGTFFPPVRNPPPIPAQSVRTLESGPRKIFVQENLPRDFPPPFAKEGLFSSEGKEEDQRWYLREKQSNEADSNSDQSSAESFERYYQSGEPAVGPVATPIPDDVYLSQPSRLNPKETVNSDLWFLTRRPYNQYTPDRWVQMQLPSEGIVEIVNQDPGPPLATDTVKPVVIPVPPEVPVKPQFTASTLANIIQQIWFRSRESTVPRAIRGPPNIIEDVPPVKQVIDIPAERIVREETVKDESDMPLPPPDTKPIALIPKKPFNPPPPPPPPLKGYDSTLKNRFPLPINVIPDSNTLIGDNGLLQEVRHVWVPTSARTGKFISFSVPTPLASDKPIVNAVTSLDSAPITVSDTWVLKQEGPIPSFEQIKPLFPPRTQSVKTIFQDPPIIKVEAPPNPPIIVQEDVPKSPVIEKSEDSEPPVDIWPVRSDVPTPKGMGNVVDEIVPEAIPASPKVEEVAITTSLLPPKILVNSKPPISLPVPPPPVRIVNGKPCPIPILQPLPPKYFLSPKKQTIIAVPKLTTTPKRPVASIIRVNRYPSGSYYLLNNRIKPSFLTYPPNAPVLPAKFIRLVQSNQIPLPPKTIPVPQSKQFPAPVPAKQVLFPFQASQTAAPVPAPKSSRIIYPATQFMKYSYPWNPKNSPVPGKGVYVSQFSPKAPESSSDAEPKTEKLEKEENPEKDDEREKESSSEETEESKEKVERIEVAESEFLAEISEPDAIILLHPDEGHSSENSDPSGSVPKDHVSEDLINDPSAETPSKTDLNSISNHVTNSGEDSTEDMTTAFVRD